MSKESRIFEHNLISNLPDGVMSDILSRLPTKDAVRTSILSKDWEFKWTRIHKYVFSDGNWLKAPDGRPSFAKFVERTLLISQNMQSFRLRCMGEYDLLRWITVALRRGVCSIDVECPRCPPFVLPHNILTCRELRLNIHPCTFTVPKKVCFSNLTTLDLTSVTISNERDRVEFYFPLLEKLKMMLCKWFNIKSVEIHAPKMTSLHLADPAGNGDSSDCSFKITAAADGLVRLNWYARTQSQLDNIAISGLDNVVYARLEHYFGKDGALRPMGGRDDVFLEKSGLQFRKLLKELSRLKELEVYGDVLEVITISRPGVPLPRYYNMERLALGYVVCTEALVELLHAMPYLKFLSIHVMYLTEYDYDAEKSVPSCIVSHLENVTFTLFTGNMSEMKLVKFFLKKAVQLKSLVIHPRSLKSPMSEKERCVVIEELSIHPKASTCLNLTVEEVKLKLNVANLTVEQLAEARRLKLLN